MANLIFLYDDSDSDGPFVASDFDGTAQVSENFDSDFDTLIVCDGDGDSDLCVRLSF